MLSKHAPDLLHRIAAGPSPTTGRASELIERTLLDALEATVDTASLDNDLRQTLEEALHRVQLQSKINGASRLALENELRSLLDEHAGVRHRYREASPLVSNYGVPVPALHAGHQLAGVPFSNGRGSVDWMQVPPRVLGSNEDGIRWEVHQAPDEAWEIRVTVTAAPGAVSEDNHVLLARIYGPDEPLPLTIIQLARKGANYTGTAHISTWSDTIQNPGANILDVDIYTELYVSAPRHGSRRSEGALERRQIKELIARRVRTAVSASSLEPHEKGPAIVLAAELAAATAM
jgi:hypothetical protein